MNETIIVTGGAGFIGSNFILRWLEQESAAVVNLDFLTYAGNPANLATLSDDPRYHFVHGDINDRDLVNRILRQHQPAAIVHFAAESHVDRSILGPDEFIRTNINGTFSLLREAKDYWVGLGASDKQRFRFLHVSTDEVYGSLSETTRRLARLRPITQQSLRRLESSFRSPGAGLFHTYGLPTLTTNCSNNYGPFQFPEKLIPLVIQDALKGEPLPITVLARTCATAFCRRPLLSDSTGASPTPGRNLIVGGRTSTAISTSAPICGILDELSPASPVKPYETLSVS